MNDDDARPLDSLHHVAVAVSDVAAAVNWYRENFACAIGYQDETWALLRFANCSVALVVPAQHPPHLGFVVPPDVAARHGELKTHRDGTRSIYIADPSGNPVELLSADSV